MEANRPGQSLPTPAQHEFSQEAAAQSVAVSTLLFQRKLSHEFDLLHQVYSSNQSRASQALILVYKTTIEQLNEILAGDLGPGSLDATLDGHQDLSTEAVADRLVVMASELYPCYLEAHPELNEDIALDRFTNQISEGMTQGVAEAREILDGVNALDEEIETQLDESFDLTMEGVDTFRESFSFINREVDEDMFNELGDAEDYEATTSLDELLDDY